MSDEKRTTHNALSSLIPHYSLLFLLALLPRLAALGRYVTPDELIWVYRAIRFREALLAGDWANTIQTGHPGVITTWLGATAVQLQLWLQPASKSSLDWILQLAYLSPDNGAAFKELAVFITAVRLPLILVLTLGVVAVYHLARSRLSPQAALLGAALLALDPFIAGLSGIFHLDALLGTWMLLAVLAALPKEGERRVASGGWKRAMAAGGFTALAIMTKSPGLLLLPFIPAIFLWYGWRDRAWRPLFIALTAFSVSAIVAALLILPALWVTPLEVAALIGGLANRFVAEAARPTFFMGQVIYNPGPLFYPVALAFRLSPVGAMGVLTAVILLIQKARRGRWEQIAPALWLLLYALAFLLLLTMAEKKFDRYALPAIMALLMLAGWGIDGLAAQMPGTLFQYNTGKRNVYKCLASGIYATAVILQLLYLLFALPYPLTAYNWFLGGRSAAANVLPAGWGEYESQAARELADLPDAASRTLYAANLPAVAPFYPGAVVAGRTAAIAQLTPDDILLLTSGDWNAVPNGSLKNELIANYAPLHRSWAQGVERARAYSGLERAALPVPQISPIAVDFRFQQAARITAAGGDGGAWPGDASLLLTWKAIAPDAFTLRLELLDEAGNVWSDWERPLLNVADHPPRYWTADEAYTVAYQLPIPPDLPPGDYRIAASLYDAAGARLGAFDEAANRFIGVAAPAAQIAIAPPLEQPPLTIPAPLGDEQVVGTAVLPPQMGQGERLAFDLWLQTDQPAQGSLVLLVGDERLTTPLDARGWTAGQTYRIRPAWQLLVEAADDAPLALDWLDENGRSLLSAPVSLGNIRIERRDLSFELPPAVEPMGIQAGTALWLQDVEVEIVDGRLQSNLLLQANEPDGRAYTLFFHLRDQAGAIIAQSDHPPAPPTDTWVAGQVVVDQSALQLPPDGCPACTLAIGFYDPQTGVRLRLYDEEGRPLADDQFVVDALD